MQPAHLRFVLVALSTLSLGTAYYRSTTADLMSEAATNFIQSLDDQQRAEAVFPMNVESRRFWHFIPSTDVAIRYPHPRPGLKLEQMTAEQRHLAAALLSAGLSREGYCKARTIMSLEAVLKRLEGDSGVRRNPLKYHFSIFGKPSPKGVWGYRIEGHHVSLHYTVVNGRLAGAPTFFGANPRRVPEGPRTGLRTLPREEDLGRKLVRSLDAGQRREAIVAERAYKDILTSADRVASLEGQPSGLAASRLSPEQRKILDALVAEYAGNLPPEIAQYRTEQYRQAGDDIHFAWAGSTEVGEAHYYRVQAPAFLIEYDCIQNKANHIHSVWRDYKGDFGMDLLAEHYANSH